MDGLGEGGRWSDLPEQASEVLIALNPKAGAGTRHGLVDQVCDQLRSDGFQVDVLTEIDRVAERAAEGLERGTLRAVVAAGGDGTASLLTNRTSAATPIALLPLGTENLLAKHLGVRPDVVSVCSPIRAGRTVHLDAGRANGRLFLLMVGCGFDAEVVRQLDEGRTGHISHWSYFKPIMRTIRSYQYPRMRVYSDDTGTDDADERSIQACWVFVLNLPCYARGLGIGPDACGTDGMLDAVTFQHGSLADGLRYLGGVVLGMHRRWKDCVAFRSPRIRIEADEAVPYQVDGDAAGHLPLEIEVLPERLRLLVPVP